MAMENRMQTQNRFFEDLARLASGAMSGVFGVRQEIEARLRDQFERLLGSMDLVRREEFEAVKSMAAAARRDQEMLSARLAALEARLAEGDPRVRHAAMLEFPPGVPPSRW
jgi:BMFP domain-containing protein YqiC